MDRDMSSYLITHRERGWVSPHVLLPLGESKVAEGLRDSVDALGRRGQASRTLTISPSLLMMKSKLLK
jgi:hypothetical protein